MLITMLPTKYFLQIGMLTIFIGVSAASFAEDRIELDTTVIKGNTELPKILYVVPWQDAGNRRQQQQKLKLHSLFGEFFDPVKPDAPDANSAKTSTGDARE